jgi:hypothetical protein
MPKRLSRRQYHLLILAGGVVGLFAAAGVVGPASILPWGRVPPGMVFYLFISTISGGFINWAAFRP